MTDDERIPSNPVIPPASLRPMTPDDLDPVVLLESRVHVAPWTRENFEGEWDKPYSESWVLTDDETDAEIFGYVVFWTLDDTIEILNLAVDLSYRGLGFAKKILHQVIRLAVRRGSVRVVLDVRKSNLPAVGLYQRAGFTIIQLRKVFYSNGEDAYHMELNVTGDAGEF